MKVVLSAKQGVLELLYKANGPLGLRLKITSGPSFKTVRQWFYVAMRKHSPEFDHLVLVNMDGDLWIVNRNSQELKDAKIYRTVDPSYDPLDGGEL